MPNFNVDIRGRHRFSAATDNSDSYQGSNLGSSRYSRLSNSLLASSVSKLLGRNNTRLRSSSNQQSRPLSADSLVDEDSTKAVAKGNKARKKLKRKHRQRKARKLTAPLGNSAVLSAVQAEPTLSSAATQFSTARDIGNLSSNPTISDSVGSSNPFDDYRFSLSTPSTYQLVLSGLSSSTNVQLLDSSGTLIKAAEGTPTQAGTIDGALASGTYYIRISAAAADTNYMLAATSRSAREVARSAYSFVDSMGVVTHLRYLDTSYGNFDGVIKPKLQELGIRHVRDGGTDPGFLQRVNQLGSVGIKSTLVIDPRDGYTPANAVPILKQVLPAVEAIEGPNEWDVNPTLFYEKQAFPSGIYQFQSQLYNAIKSDAATASIPVIAPSLANPYNSEKLGSLSSVVDLGNMHSYAGGNQPNADLDWKWIPQAQAVSGSNKSIVATEAGWHNATNDLGSSQRGVSEAVSGKYIPRTYLEYFNRGVKRTFMYELINQRQAGDQENNFGLLRADGSPKPAFNATRNLISVLNDPVESSQLGSLDYYLTGNTQNVHHTLLQKSSGDFYLVMWVEAPSTDVDMSQNVTLNLMSPISQATTYLPNQSTNPTANYTSPTQLTLNIPDHPLIVQLRPDG